ncbi:aspartate aminotransferase family protein [Pseudomonas sp. XS1P51]
MINEFDLVRPCRHYVAGSNHFDMLTGLVRGEGVWLFDTQDRKYLDCYSQRASVGHHHPAVTKAIGEKACQLNINPYFIDEHVVNYAERLTSSLPGELSLCFFVYTETQAIELAMRIAQIVTKKSGAIVMENAGNCNLLHRDEYFDDGSSNKEWTPQIVAVEPPNTYRPPFTAPDISKRYIKLIDDAINTLDINGRGVAAFMCDSIFAMEGFLEAPSDYFDRVYTRIRLAGGLCIADEMQAGMGRTGLMWGFEHYDVVPDIVISGQSVWPGLPMSVVVTTAAIGQAFQHSGGHFNNVMSNALSTAVENAVFKEIDKLSLLENVQAVGRYLRSELQSLAARHSLIGNIQGLGFAFGIELVTDRHTMLPARQEARTAMELMRIEGVLIDAAGRQGNVLMIRLPLIFSKDNCDLLTEKLDKVLSKIAAGTKNPGIEPGSKK